MAATWELWTRAVAPALPERIPRSLLLPVDVWARVLWQSGSVAPHLPLVADLPRKEVRDSESKLWEPPSCPPRWDLGTAVPAASPQP